jgi:hypothetical protein
MVAGGAVAASGGRRVGRSIVALLAGVVVGIVLSVGTDMALYTVGLLPAPGQPATSGPLALATIYRTLYGVLSSYVIARLAPNRPMGHALAGGLLGLVVCILGAVTTWNQNLGPHWYPVALIVLAVPQAWAGGKLRVAQMTAAQAI